MPPHNGFPLLLCRMPRALAALTLLGLLTACTRPTSSGPSVVMHSALLGADLPGALPPGPDQTTYQRRLEQQAARHGLACTGTPEVMLSHAPDVLVAQAGSAVMVCMLATRMVG